MTRLDNGLFCFSSSSVTGQMFYFLISLISYVSDPVHSRSTLYCPRCFISPFFILFTLLFFIISSGHLLFVNTKNLVLLLSTLEETLNHPIFRTLASSVVLVFCRCCCIPGETFYDFNNLLGNVLVKSEVQSISENSVLTLLATRPLFPGVSSQ